MRSGDMTTFHGRLLGHLVYVRNRMTTFLHVFKPPTHLQSVRMKLRIRVKLGINFMRTNEGKCIGFD